MAHQSKKKSQRTGQAKGAQGGGAQDTRRQPRGASPSVGNAAPRRTPGAMGADVTPPNPLRDQPAPKLLAAGAEEQSSGASDTPEAMAMGVAPEAETPATETTQSPPGAPPTGRPPIALWNNWREWSNRRLFSVGAVVIGAVIVLSLLLHGLLTPAATATPGIHSTPLPPDPLIGHYAPNATMVDLSGNSVSLSSLKGKIIVFNFWYAACDPCRYEMPALEKAYLKYKSQGVVVVGIDMVDSAQTASSFVHSLGVTYPIMLDENLRTVQTYKVFATPTTFFIDRQGVIRYKSVGALNTTTLTTDLTALLKLK